MEETPYSGVRLEGIMNQNDNLEFQRGFEKKNISFIQRLWNVIKDWWIKKQEDLYAKSF